MPDRRVHEVMALSALLAVNENLRRSAKES
jgi:hypothetical protein